MRFKRFRIQGVAMMASVGAFAASMAVPVQQAAAQTAAADDGDMGLELIVTARKRSEVQRDVPVSITAFSGDSLDKAKLNQMSELVTYIPTIAIATGTTNPFIFLRGFGAGNNLSIDQSVGKFIDNVSYGRDQDIRIPLFDLERLEVLKGPQVLLFGNSSTAGALNITTKKPGFTFEADASATYEFNQNEVVVQGGLTLPMSDKVSLRVAGYFLDLSKGWVKNSATGQDEPVSTNWAARATLLMQPTETLEVRLKAEYDHLRTDGETAESVAQSFFPIFSDTKLDGIRDSNDNVAPFFSDNFTAMNAELYQGDISLEAAGGTFYSTTAYRKTLHGVMAEDSTPFPLVTPWIKQSYKQFSQELRYQAKIGQLDLLLGGYYQNGKLRSTSLIDLYLGAAGIPLPDFTRLVPYDEKSVSYSGFVDTTYHVTDDFSIAAGFRYTRLEKTADQSNLAADIMPGKTFGTTREELLTYVNPALTPIFDIINGAPQRVTTGLKHNENHFQPQVVLQYKLAPKINIYGKFVRGAKNGGFDFFYAGSDPENSDYAPEKATSFEAGIKGLILDNKLEFSVVAFNTNFKNVQVSSFEGTSFLVSNVGKARTRGVEVDLTWITPVEGLRVTWAGSFLDAEYLEFPNGPCTRAQEAVKPAGTTCRADLSGQDTPYSSKWTGSLQFDYKKPIGGYTLDAGVAFLYRSRYFSNLGNEPLLVQKAYAQIDARLAVGPEDGRWTLGVFGKNLTDKQYIENSSTIALAPGGLFASLSRGRQLGLRLTAKY